MLAVAPDFVQLFRDLVRRVTKLEQRSAWANSGMSPTAPGEVTVDGSLVVGSGEAKSGNFAAGATGWHLGSDGNVEVNDITLRGGIIGNEALTNPVIPNSVWKGTTANFGLAVAWTALVSESLTIPAGVTSVQVLGFVRLVAANSTASKDYLYSNLDIGGLSSGGFSTPVAPGDYGTSFCSFARTMTGLTPGDTVTLTALGSTGSAAWASGPNVCQISASVTWYR